jgi:hypothetical protein
VLLLGNRRDRTDVSDVVGHATDGADHPPQPRARGTRQYPAVPWRDRRPVLVVIGEATRVDRERDGERVSRPKCHATPT